MSFIEFYWEILCARAYFSYDVRNPSHGMIFVYGLPRKEGFAIPKIARARARARVCRVASREEKLSMLPIGVQT